MTSASDKKGEGQAAEPADFSHLADAMKDMPHVPLHPLMAHPTAALAAATAIGFGLATHMTSVFLGSLHGAIDATNKLARRLEDEQGKGEGATAADEPVPADVSKGEVPEGASRPKATRAGTAGAKAKPGAGEAKTAEASDVAKPAATDKPVAVKAPVVKTAKANGKADDLKRIEGIGPKLEQVLNGRGIRRFADLAALGAAELEALDQAIGLDGRAIRDDWAGQALKLARGRK